MRSDMASIKVCLMKCLLSQSFDCQYFGVFEKPMRLQVFDLKTKFITSDKTLIRRLSEIVGYNVVKLKVEILSAFFWAFISFNFVTIRNEYSTTQNLLKHA